MTAGPVNRTALEANYQNPGDIYSDLKTEGAFGVLADQIDANWTVLDAATGVNGSKNIGSPAIAGVSGTTVYDQIVSVEGQIQSIQGGVVPAGTITTAMLADGAVTLVKQEKMLQVAAIGGLLKAYQNCGGW